VVLYRSTCTCNEFHCHMLFRRLLRTQPQLETAVAVSTHRSRCNNIVTNSLKLGVWVTKELYKPGRNWASTTLLTTIYTTLGLVSPVRRMESSNYSGDKWWPTHRVIQQIIIIDSLMGKGDLERSREVRDMAVETKKHRAYVSVTCISNYSNTQYNN